MSFHKFPQISPNFSSNGAIALSTILGITLIITVLATGLALVSFTEGLIGFAAIHIHKTHLVAQAGIYDGLWRLVRNRDFSASYNLAVGVGTASVSFSRTGVPAQHVRIISIGDSHGNRRRMEALVLVDDRTGEIRIVSWRETPI
jgi:hypothetical protein